MSVFCSDGYVPSQIAIIEASQSWFGDRWVELEATAAASQATEPEPKDGALALVLTQPPLPRALEQALTEIFLQTAGRLRNVLFEGKLLTAYYFGGVFEGRHEVSPGFWATPQADGVLESGAYYPFGKPGRWYERPLICPIFFQRAELTTLLSVQQSSKKQLPESKKADLRPPFASSTTFRENSSARWWANFQRFSPTTSPMRFSVKRQRRRRAHVGARSPINRGNNRGNNRGAIFRRQH